MTQPAVQMGQINLSLIRFHPRNVRRSLGDLRDLCESIRELGVLQPVSVDQFPDFTRLRAGHRRVAAARIVGLRTIPGVIHRQPLTDQQFIISALHENLHRADLEPAERAAAIAALRADGLSMVEVAARLGVSDTTVRNWALHLEAPAAARVTVPPAEPTARSDYRPRKAKLSTTVPRAAVSALVDAWAEQVEAGLSWADGHALLQALRELASPTPKQTA